MAKHETSLMSGRWLWPFQVGMAAIGFLIGQTGRNLRAARTVTGVAKQSVRHAARTAKSIHRRTPKKR